MASIYYIAPVVLHNLLNQKITTTLWQATILYFFNYRAAWQSFSEYGRSNVFDLVVVALRLNYFQSFMLSIISKILFCLLAFIIINTIMKALLKNKYLTFPMIIVFFVVTQTSIYILSDKFESNSVVQMGLLLVVTLLTNKIWILFIAGQHCAFNSKKIEPKKLLTNGIAYFSMPRESFDLGVYSSKSLVVFLKGIVGCIAIIIFNQLFFGPTRLFFNNEVLCPAQISTYSFLSNHGSTIQAWFCLFRTEFIFSIINHLILGFFSFLIPGYLVGLNFSFPVGNIFKARTFAGFLHAISYYYSLMLNKFFIIEIYKILKLIVNSKKIIFISILIGVFIGGAIFHVNRDYHYMFFYHSNYFRALLQQPLAYYFMLAFLCSMAHLQIFKFKSESRILNKAFLMLYLVVFLIIRFINGFFVNEDFSSQLKYVGLLFGVSW